MKRPVLLLLLICCLMIGGVSGFLIGKQQQLPVTESSEPALVTTEETIPVVEEPVPAATPPQGSPQTTTNTLQEFATFPTAILQATGKKVLAYDPDAAAHQELSQAIMTAMQEICVILNATDSPIKGLRRINEASSYFEDLLLEKLDALPTISCGIPLNAKGNEQRSGYPDLHLTHTPTGTHFYLDPKLYETKSEKSSLRTFYYSPTSKSGKIHHDAVHLLLGIRHDGNDGDWNFEGVKLVTLHPLSLKLKSEYNASNADLYKDEMLISESQ